MLMCVHKLEKKHWTPPRNGGNTLLHYIAIAIATALGIKNQFSVCYCNAKGAIFSQASLSVSHRFDVVKNEEPDAKVQLVNLCAKVLWMDFVASENAAD